MNFRVGQKVSYPNHGVCKIERIGKKSLGEPNSPEFYSLRVLANNSLIYVPVANAESIGIRPIINSVECQALMKFLSAGFEEPIADWKTRTKEFGAKLQSGDIFEAADVLKKLTFRSRLKKLSFREQRMLERAKFLVVSELALVCSQSDCQIEAKVDALLTRACENHNPQKAKSAAAY